jgi:ribosomal protein S18 acetylase RimI-like enzyme
MRTVGAGITGAAFSDTYLDGELEADRLAVWRVRLAGSEEDRVTLVAEHCDGVVGFAHTVLDAEPPWGALVDNLHVRQGDKRRGIGTRLLRATAEEVMRKRPDSPIFLWVLEQNTAAQAFYLARGGRRREAVFCPAPGGDPGNLVGTPRGIRVAWPEPAVLVAPE